MPLESEPQSDYVRKFQVAILDNSALTDDLTDAEAKLYLDWALAVAEKVAQTVQNESDAEEKRDTLMKLLRVMSRLVTHRQEKDNEWFLSMLEKLSTLQISLINTGLSEQYRQRVTSLYDSDNATLLQHLTKLLLEPSTDEESDKNILAAPPGQIETYQPPDTDIKPYESPKSDIETFTPSQRDSYPRPSNSDNGQSEH
jgi:hypothetical protein